VNYWDGTQTKLWYVAGQLGRLEDPGGEVTDFAYAAGLLTKVRDPLQADAVAATVAPDDDTTRTLLTYDAASRLTPLQPAAPAPASCFDATTRLPNGTCTTPAPGHTRTDYDGAMAGLAGTYWANTTLSASPAAHGTGNTGAVNPVYCDPNGAVYCDWGTTGT